MSPSNLPVAGAGQAGRFRSIARIFAQDQVMPMLVGMIDLRYLLCKMTIKIKERILSVGESACKFAQAALAEIG